MEKKMLIIGAGSAMFTQGLVIDMLLRQPGGHQWSVGLCDTDADALDGITRLVKKMVKAKGLDMEVTASTERRDLLPGSDYVISTIGVGGRRAWEQDVFIPRKYGVFQPVGDTALPGGISRAMRMVPVMVALLKDVKALAPNARFFNYANPMAVIMRALHKAVDFPAAGLCIGTIGSEWGIADYMGYDRNRFTTMAAGINHCTFIYDFRYDGQCVKNDIMARAQKDYGGLFNGSAAGLFCDDRLTEPFAWQFFLRHGVYPAPGDRHITEFFTEYFMGGQYFGKILGVDAFSFEGTIEWGDRIHAEAMALGRSDAPLDENFFERLGGEHEQLTDIIDAIEYDRRRVYYVNLPNGGSVPNLPLGAVLEMPALATANGLIPLNAGGFPDAMAAMTNRFLAGVEITAEAALKGDRKLMEEAIMMSGCLQDKEAVRKMTEELLLAQKAYLPQF